MQKGNRIGQRWELRFGARVLPGGGVTFRVWAPRAKTLAIRILGDEPRTLPMTAESVDEFALTIPDAAAGDDYLLALDDGRLRPDPVSRWQAHGVHGPSRIVDPGSFQWTDRHWKGMPLRQFVIYEIHAGAFTSEGTFEAIIPRLPYLRQLGITAVELMPVVQFPGDRNWGYDGAGLYAPHSCYGGPDGFKRLVDACHGLGLAVILDVVYNHLGPEGSYLGDFAPCYTRKYRTPWGDAINFDGPNSDGVRRYFIDNALYWQTEFHIDALRLDAVHEIFDFSARHFLEELADVFSREAEGSGRMAWIIAESDLDDVRIIAPHAEGGYGLDAQWHDDFHHALHAVLTGAKHGYLADFGEVADLKKALCDGFVYDGRYSPYRRRRHGSSSKGRPGEQFVACIQNHDQIANACRGSRLSQLVSLEQQKLAAAVVLCSPFVPLLFMGEEYGETAPFFYFTSFVDATLAEAVREGRRKEYADFYAKREFPDPQAAETFQRSKLSWTLLEKSPHAEILRFHRDLLALRKELASLSNCRKDLTRVDFDERSKWLVMERGDPSGARALLICNFLTDAQAIPIRFDDAAWRLALWSGNLVYGGTGASAPMEFLAKEPRTPLEVSTAGFNALLYIA